MLKGTLTYQDETFKEPIEFTVYGKDTGVLNLYFCYDGNNLVKETAIMNLWDSKLKKDGTLVIPSGANDYGDKWRRLNIKKSNAIQTNLQNMLFASRVAALTRYADEYGERVVEGESNDGINQEVVYSSTFNFKVDKLGTFSKQLGFLTSMHLQNKYVKIDMEEFDESNLELQMFSTFKAKDKYDNQLTKTPIRNVGFKYNAITLGFEYKPRVAIIAERDDGSNLMGLYSTMQEVIDAHPDKNFKWLNDRKYEIVTDETLEDVMKAYEEYDGIIGIDTETSGLGITFKSRTGEDDQLVGICMSMKEGTGHYFPLQMKYCKNLCNGDHWYFMERYMKKFCETHKFVTHNLSFDWKVFYIYGINLNAVFDTMLAYGVTERYKQTNFEYGLKDLTHNLFGWDMIELSDMVFSGKWGKNNEIRFWDLPYELVRNYAPTDADMTLTLYHHVLKIKLLESFQAEEVFKIELKYAKVIAYSEFHGYHIDIDRLPQMIDNICKGKDNAQQDLFKMAGEEFNPNSTKDLQRIMFDQLGIPDVSHKRSTAKESLKELAEMTDEDDKPMYPFAAKLLEYRGFESTYKNFIKRKDEFLTPDGFIFPHVYTFGTNTGRVSVKEPNYQSYNDVVKKYVCPRKGYKMWDSDFSQIEYRVLCSMAHEPALIASFADPDMDYHTYQAARMFGVPYGAVTKQMRQQCKGINFGLPYGMGDNSLGARIFGARTAENTAKAANLRELYFEGQDNIRNFFDTVRDEGVKNGYTRTLFGRLRFYHKSSFSEAQIRRQAGNHVIQGTAADLYKFACVRVFEMLERRGWLDKVLLNAFIHDEILGEVSEDINFYDFVKEWRAAFEVPMEGFCKLYAGLGIGNSWYEAKKADWPPQLIDIIINSERKDHWDNNGQAMIDWVKEAFYQYGIDRVKTYIEENIEHKKNGTLTDNIIKPVIDAFLKEKVNDYYDKLDDEGKKALETLIGKEIVRGKKGIELKDLQDWLKIFCYWQNYDYSLIDIVAPSNEVSSKQKIDMNPNVDLIEMSNDEFLVNRVKYYGFHLEYINNALILNMNLLDVLGKSAEFVSLFCKSEGTFKVTLVDFSKGKPDFVETPCFVMSSDLMLIQTYMQDLLIQYQNLVRV